MDVLLALWLLGVSEAEVLPLTRVEEFLTRVCLRQQPCFYLIVWVYANPEGTTHYNTSRSINYEYLRTSNPFFTRIFETVVYAGAHLNVREPVEKSAHT